MVTVQLQEAFAEKRRKQSDLFNALVPNTRYTGQGGCYNTKQQEQSMAI
jgi:hypothetical protein